MDEKLIRDAMEAKYRWNRELARDLGKFLGTDSIVAYDFGVGISTADAEKLLTEFKENFPNLFKERVENEDAKG